VCVISVGCPSHNLRTTLICPNSACDPNLPKLHYFESVQVEFNCTEPISKKKKIVLTLIF